MATLKLSQIAPALVPPALTDQFVGVTGGTTDNLYSLSQFGRIKLSADTIYYVSNAGSDSNPGTQTQPWLTLQHAFDYLALNIDGGGFGLKIQLADGTYDGVEVNGFPPNLKRYDLQGNDASPNNVVIGQCPTFNNSCIELSVLGIAIQISGVLLQRSKAGFLIPLSLDNLFQVVFLGKVNFDSQSGVFSAGHDCIAINGNFAYAQGAYNVSGMTVRGAINIAGDWDNFIEVAPLALFYSGACIFSSTGTINFGTAFLNLPGGTWQDFDTVFVSVTATGPRYSVFSGGSVVSLSGTALGPNFFPGNAAGTVDGGSSYDNFVGSYSGSGLPTTATFVDPGTGAIYKDTSGGGVYWVFNDGGTIKKVQLT